MVVVWATTTAAIAPTTTTKKSTTTTTTTTRPRTTVTFVTKEMDGTIKFEEEYHEDLNDENSEYYQQMVEIMMERVSLELISVQYIDINILNGLMIKWKYCYYKSLQ